MTRPKESSRRLATVWFADVVGYTTLSSIDEDAAIAVVKVLQRLCRDLVPRHSGRVVKCGGDSTLCLFENTEDAIRAASSLLTLFDGDATVSHHGAKLRIGVNVCEVLVAADGDIYGDGVNLAARLQGRAQPGQVLASEAIYRLIKQRPSIFKAEQLGEQQMKGLVDPTPTYAVSLQESELAGATAPPDERERPAWDWLNDLPGLIQYQRDIRGVLKDPRLAESLSLMYPDHRLLTRCDLTYPVAILSTAKRPVLPRHDPIFSASEPFANLPVGLCASSSEYREFRKAMGKVTESGETYRMKTFVENNGSPTLDCQIGTYFDSLDSSDCLQWELQKVFSSRWPDMTRADLFDSLPLRRKLQERVGDPVTNGDCRSAGVAVSVLTVYPENERYAFWLRWRPEDAPNPDQLHVIPSFWFQPEQGRWPEEFCLTHNVKREFFEELFNVKAPPDVQWNWFYGRPPVIDLTEMLDEGRAELWITGICVNLLNLRPEVCALLLIRDKEWAKRNSDPGLGPDNFLKLNDEFESERARMRRRGRAVPVDYSNLHTDKELLSATGLIPSGTVPPGAAAFWMGVDLLRELTL